MAYETGTVTDLADLIDVIRTFVTSHADLVADGQEWTELSYVASGVNGVIGQTYFQAPGLDGTEEIIVGMRPLRYPDVDAHSIGFHMAQDWNGALAFLAQPGTSAERYTPTSDSAMEYWLVANGRRLVGVIKISTVYTSFYLGKILPWGSTGDYPLPFFLGCNTNLAGSRWSFEGWDFRMFCDPGAGSAQLLKPGLIWEDVRNYSGIEGSPPSGFICTLPYNSYVDQSFGATAYQLSIQPRTLWANSRENIDGTYSAFPIVLHSNGSDLELFGELDGVFAVSGFDNFAENIVTISGDAHLVVPNIGRSGRHDYFALRLV